MLQVDQLIRGDGGGRRGGHTHLGTQGVVQQADGLVGAVACQDRFLLCGTGAALEFVSDEAGQVKGGVVQQLLGDADGRRQLVSAQGDLVERHIALGDLRFLLDPARGAVVGHQRDLTVAGRGADDVDEATHDVLILQRLDELIFKLIGHSIAALSQLADLQSVAHIVVHPATDGIPESLLVGIGSGAPLVVSNRRRTLKLSGQHGVGGVVHLAVHLLGAFHALDGVAHVHDILLHALVLLGVLGAHHAILVLVLVQEGLRLIPQFGALLAHFKNLTQNSVLLDRYRFASLGIIKASRLRS